MGAGRSAPFNVTRTNWPGCRKPAGLGSSARASLVLVLPETRTSVKLGLPDSLYTLPSASFTVTSKRPSRGSLRRPVSASRASLTRSSSETLNRT